jgi:2-hydroxy-3-keto-5-methylthiopentenyl-1-phosphate phosphatase
MYEQIIFVDFDGTVTSEETLSGAVMRLNPQGLSSTMERMLSEELTLAEGLNMIFASIPSSRFREIEDYIRTVPARPGFGEFLTYCNGAKVPVVIISGGLTQMVDITLAPYRDLILDVYSVLLDTSGDTMRMVSEYGNGREFMDKIRIMDKYEYRKAICIGDGYTDFDMAKNSDMVFARDHLAEHLTEENITFYPWNDFFDIIEVMKSAE